MSKDDRPRQWNSTQGSAEARFWGKVARGEGCWEWQGHIGNRRYGRVRFANQERDYTMTPSNGRTVDNP